MYSHILFDMDDTIFDFQKAQLCSFKSVLARYNMLFSIDYYYHYQYINHILWQQFECGMISKEIVQDDRFAQFFKIIDMDIDGKTANIVYQDNLATQTWLVPHAEETCMELSKHCNLSIVTNGVGRTQKRRFALSEISAYFDNIAITEDIGVAKPDKVFFDRVFKLINRYNRNKILLVGDSLTSDIQGANNVGIDCCWYNPKQIRLNKSLQIKYTVTDLIQLIDIVKNI